MTNYDNKLGAWFKDIEKTAKDFKAKKKASGQPQDQPIPPDSTGEPTVVEIEKPLRETAVSDVNAAEQGEVVAKVITREEPVDGTGQAAPRNSQLSSPRLFDDADVSPVEDFLSFLDRPREHQENVIEEQIKKMPEEPAKNDIPNDEALLNLPEGTGEPRPVSTNQPAKASEPAPVESQQPVIEKPEPPFITPEPVKKVEAQAEAKPFEQAASTAEVKPKPVPAAVISDELEIEMEDDAVAEAKWDRLPQQLQTLFSSVGEEVAQNSYKTFKESRASLIQRLLDPPLTLEEAARILNVCPTTVRRYTNRGVLKHYRTIGNQRRFKLSDVLFFMENSGRSSAEALIDSTATDSRE